MNYISQDTEFIGFIGFVEMARLLRPDKSEFIIILSLSLRVPIYRDETILGIATLRLQ